MISQGGPNPLPPLSGSAHETIVGTPNNRINGTLLSTQNKYFNRGLRKYSQREVGRICTHTWIFLLQCMLSATDLPTAKMYISSSKKSISSQKSTLRYSKNFLMQALKILTKVDFYAFFKISHFSRFTKFISSLCKNCCMHFVPLNKIAQDSPNRIELDSSIL